MVAAKHHRDVKQRVRNVVDRVITMYSTGSVQATSRRMLGNRQDCLTTKLCTRSQYKIRVKKSKIKIWGKKRKKEKAVWI